MSVTTFHLIIMSFKVICQRYHMPASTAQITHVHMDECNWFGSRDKSAFDQMMRQSKAAQTPLLHLPYIPTDERNTYGIKLRLVDMWLTSRRAKRLSIYSEQLKPQINRHLWDETDFVAFALSGCNHFTSVWATDSFLQGCERCVADVVAMTTDITSRRSSTWTGCVG